MREERDGPEEKENEKENENDWWEAGAKDFYRRSPRSRRTGSDLCVLRGLL
jgi:hypothetical protein